MGVCCAVVLLDGRIHMAGAHSFARNIFISMAMYGISVTCCLPINTSEARKGEPATRRSSSDSDKTIYGDCGSDYLNHKQWSRCCCSSGNQRKCKIKEAISRNRIWSSCAVFSSREVSKSAEGKDTFSLTVINPWQVKYKYAAVRGRLLQQPPTVDRHRVG